MQAEVINPRWRLTNRNTYISACTQRSDKIPTAISMFSWSRNSMKLFLILCYASGSHKSKMAAHKPEILISQPVHNVAAKFQRLYSCFQVQEFNGAFLFIVLCKRKSKIQDGGSQIQAILISQAEI